jgi:hypothetical protein
MVFELLIIDFVNDMKQLIHERAIATGRELLIAVGDVSHPAAINEIKLVIMVMAFILARSDAKFVPVFIVEKLCRIIWQLGSGIVSEPNVRSHLILVQSP